MPKVTTDTTSEHREVYTQIFDMFTAAINFDQLESAALVAQDLIKQNRIDEESAMKLEEYGIQRFNKIQRDLNNISFIVSRNRKAG